MILNLMDETKTIDRSEVYRKLRHNCADMGIDGRRADSNERRTSFKGNCGK